MKNGKRLMTLTLVSYSTNQAPFIAGIRKLLNKINWLFFLAEKIWNDVCVAFFFFGYFIVVSCCNSGRVVEHATPKICHFGT